MNDVAIKLRYPSECIHVSQRLSIFAQVNNSFSNSKVVRLSPVIKVTEVLEKKPELADDNF